MTLSESIGSGRCQDTGHNMNKRKELDPACQCKAVAILSKKRRKY